MSTLTELTKQAQQRKLEGRHSEALDIFKQMSEMAPNNPAVLHNYAASLGDAGRNRDAVSVLRKAFSLGINEPASWLVFARALSGIQEFDQARDAFSNLLHLRPLDPDAHREFAQLIWMQTGDREKALAVLNKAIEQNPSVAGLHIARAQVFGQTGEPETEYAVIKQAATLSGDPHLEYAACNSALACEDFDAAVEFGRSAAEKLPEEDGAVAALATALLGAGEAHDAAFIIERLRDRQPVNQLFIALQITAWRLTGDERYHLLMDYEKVVMASPLDVPDGWSSLESFVDDLIEGLDEAHSFKTHPFFQSVRHGSQISSITGSENAAMQAVETAAMGPARRYVEKLKGGADPLRRRNIGACRMFSSWSISLPPDGFHVNHVHPEGWLSSACHLRAPVPEEDEPRAGWLKFGEPGVATAPALEPEHFVKPEPGVMVLFPSYMWHGTIGFKNPPARLTFAADFVPARSDG